MNQLVSLLLTISMLQGCAVTVVELLGFGATTEVATGGAVSSTAVSIAQTLDIAKTTGDVVSFVDTGKTLTDHVISKYTGKDCRTFNILEEKEVCLEVEKQNRKKGE